MAKKEKTNACRILDQKKIPYDLHPYYDSGAVGGEEVASTLGEDPDRVFKTLVLVGKSKDHYVLVIPSNENVDLKKAAKVLGEKSIQMIPQKDLEPLTGYIHGGCSPVGMKKTFPTYFQEEAVDYPTIYVSAGRVGLQMEVSIQDLKKVLNYRLADLVVKDADPGH